MHKQGQDTQKISSRSQEDTNEEETISDPELPQMWQPPLHPPTVTSIYRYTGGKQAGCTMLRLHSVPSTLSRLVENFQL